MLIVNTMNPEDIKLGDGSRLKKRIALLFLKIHILKSMRTYATGNLMNWHFTVTLNCRQFGRIRNIKNARVYQYVLHVLSWLNVGQEHHHHLPSVGDLASLLGSLRLNTTVMNNCSRNTG